MGGSNLHLTSRLIFVLVELVFCGNFLLLKFFVAPNVKQLHVVKLGVNSPTSSWSYILYGFIETHSYLSEQWVVTILKWNGKISQFRGKKKEKKKSDPLRNWQANFGFYETRGVP